MSGFASSCFRRRVLLAVFYRIVGCVPLFWVPGCDPPLPFSNVRFASSRPDAGDANLDAGDANLDAEDANLDAGGLKPDADSNSDAGTSQPESGVCATHNSGGRIEKLDLLLVVDDSESMRGKQSA